MVDQLPGESMGSDQNESKLRPAFHRWRRSWESEEPGGRKVQKPRKWELSRVRGWQSKIQQCLPSQLELEVCIGWGGCAWDIGQNHMRKPMLRMIKCVWSMAEPWREPDSGLPSGIFYSVSFTSVRDWLLWYDLFAVPCYIILATCSHFS